MQSSASLKIQIAQKKGGGASSFVKTKVQNDNVNLNEMHIAYTHVLIMYLVFEKKPFQFWRQIWIQVVVILLPM